MEKQKPSTEEKIDMILGQVLTLQGQMTIMQGQMVTQSQLNSMEGRISEKLEKSLSEKLEEKMDQKFTEFKKEMDKSIDKKFKEFKLDLGNSLCKILEEAEDKIDKNEREIKKLPCVSFKTRLKKFVSKTN